jgi:CheY-like chemotaxis protein
MEGAMGTEARATVLVVDDDAAVRQVLGALAAGSGYVARLAADGDEGVAVFSRHREEIAAVVLDVLMPGKDGPQTLSELRAVDPGVRCVFVTGHSPRYSAEELAGLGAAVVAKPVGLAEFGRALDAATGRV